MPTRFLQYASIVLAGYLLTGLPAAAMVLCFSCTSNTSPTASPADTFPPALTQESHACCGNPSPAGPPQAEATQPHDASPPDEPAPQRCCFAACCKAAPTLTHRPATLTPLLLSGTQQTVPPTTIPSRTTALDPPPPRV